VDHSPDLLRNVRRLVLDGGLRQPGEVDKCEIQHIWGADLQIDRDVFYPFVRPSDPIRVSVNFVANVVEISELLTRLVKEFCPFILRVCDVDKVTNKRPVSANARSARKEIAVDNGLQDRRLARGLTANNDNLRQVHQMSTNGRENVLELVDHRNRFCIVPNGIFGNPFNCFDPVRIGFDPILRITVSISA
jgi:hypothetical protein